MKNTKTRYARSLPGQDKSGWQSLEAHSEGTAKLAADFAAAFDSMEWGEFAGRLHDLGKASSQWQEYLARSAAAMDDRHAAVVPHSPLGAAYAFANHGHAGHVLSYIIAGHHSGLSDWASSADQPHGLESRLRETPPAEIGEYAACLLNSAAPVLIPPARVCRDAGAIHLWIRMLFSCLVDADRLDAERFTAPSKSGLRDSYSSLDDLAKRFFASMDEKERAAPQTALNATRGEIRQHCLKAAELPPGFFSLSVPTGGGKTLSAMSFAFRHALRYGKKRIIYVIPYTSIIEQTAEVLAGMLGRENILEHHSNVGPENESEKANLAAENWDAPVIITTSVQFLESLYAAQAGRCRKLHNMVNSVVILDEAQLLPPKLLSPSVDALKHLASGYGVTILLSTATQPALPSLPMPCEIMPPSLCLHEKLRRVKYHFPDQNSAPVEWPELACRLQAENQVLCIVNTRRDCYELFKAMPEGTIHLSALMCGEHRSKVVAHIREELRAGRPIRVISTQLVEAGVDIDFPVVYRALAGLDSIAQAAGRCNREGKLDALGQVHVFLPPSGCPPGLLRKGEDASTNFLSNGEVLPDDPAIMDRYFKLFYAGLNDTGKKCFEELLVRDAPDGEFQFRTAASKFRLIDDYSQPVLVRYGAGGGLIETLRQSGPSRWLLRRLQRYTVNVPAWLVPGMLADGRLEEIWPGILAQGVMDYSAETGLLFDSHIPPETFVVA